MNEFGIGVITCNRTDYLLQCIKSMDGIDTPFKVIVNDGQDEVPDNKYTEGWATIQHKKNMGVSHAKNHALKFLIEQGCEYMFLIEDDTEILDLSVFDRYIEAHKASGVHHFNYGPGSAFNLKQKIKDFDLHNRHLLEQDTEPNPKMVINCDGVNKLWLFEHTVAMFSFFTRECIEKVGYFDTDYKNAWEHVDHTYRIIKAKMHPPFWYFADIYDSNKYISQIQGAIDNSVIANNDDWEKNVMEGREVYKEKHGHYPNEITTNNNMVKDFFAYIKNK